MIQNIMRSLEYAFSEVMIFFNKIIGATGTSNIIIGTILAVFVVRFIIYPGLKGGVGSSDKVSRSRVMDAEYKELD